MKILDIPCHAANYGGIRGQQVRYLVVHYTAGKNDTARNNGEYFSREAVGASAHFFVDGQQIVRSVPEDRVAWHCGGAAYRHPLCRNSNSIGVEICTGWNGDYYLDENALKNAQWLLRQLMTKYNIPPEQVIRHYDVTGKLCPLPMVGRGQPVWERFKGGLMTYQTQDAMPQWAKATTQKLMDRQILQGDGVGLDLTYDMLRLLVMLDRAGVFEKKEEAACLTH